MIFLNSVALESVAPVMIEDIRVSPIVQLPVSRDRPLQAGAAFIRARESTRTIGITFSILEQDYSTRQRYIEAVTAWALSDKPAPMQLPYHTWKLIDVLCTGLPEPSTRQWWESRLNLTFTAYEPFFYSAVEKQAACGTAFTVQGNAPPIMRIENTVSAGDDRTYSDGTKTMSFNDLPAGALVIDLNEQTAVVGSVSAMPYYTLTSSFLLPKTGAQTITGTGTIFYRERWQA